MKEVLAIFDIGSSSSLAPYLEGTSEKFILISTGTWCIFMNPFNTEPLTADHLKQDTLCYMSVKQRQVKSSRLFLGHIHDVNVKRLSSIFNVTEDAFKKVTSDEEMLWQLLVKNKQEKVFFEKGIPANFIDETLEASRFENFEEAYHQLVMDITRLAIGSLKLVVPQKDDT